MGAPALSATPALVASSTARDPSEVTYVAVLLWGADGAPLGTLCLFDLVPRPLEASALANLTPFVLYRTRALVASYGRTLSTVRSGDAHRAFSAVRSSPPLCRSSTAATRREK